MKKTVVLIALCAQVANRRRHKEGLDNGQPLVLGARLQSEDRRLDLHRLRIDQEDQITHPNLSQTMMNNSLWKGK